MQYTENIDLLKPDQNEQYDIDHFNRNADTIDGHIHDLEVGAESLRADMEAGDAASRQFQNMNGTCQISQGGTGKTTAQEALDALHSDVSTEDTLSDVDEVLFMRRTQEDVTQGIPESISVKNVLVEKLAEKIFQLMGTGGAGRFTAISDGFAPKSGNADATKFLNALGQWIEPQGKTEVIPVTASGNYMPTVPTVLRIQQNATVLIKDTSVYGVNLSIANETPIAQLVSLKMAGGSVTYKLNKGKFWKLMWNGSFWVPADEPEVGALRSTYATAAPDGWFLCNGADTTGTANELRTCFPNLYALLGNSNVLPDLRECTLVGAGRNTRDSIAAHEEYTVGQFKDDMIQNHTHTMVHTHTISHTHTRGTMEIFGQFGGGTADLRVAQSTFPPTGMDGQFPSFAEGACALVGRGYSIWGAPDSVKYGTYITHVYNFAASRAWSGNTSEPTPGSSGGASNATTSGPSGRVGATTHGKQKGVNYIIKA